MPMVISSAGFSVIFSRIENISPSGSSKTRFKCSLLRISSFSSICPSVISSGFNGSPSSGRVISTRISKIVPLSSGGNKSARNISFVDMSPIPPIVTSLKILLIMVKALSSFVSMKVFTISTTLILSSALSIMPKRSRTLTSLRAG